MIGGEMVAFGDLGHHLLIASAWAAFFICLGFGVFHSKKHKFADLV
jgi:hypothetical protein